MIPDKWQQFLKDSKKARDEGKLDRRLRPQRRLGGMRIQIGSKELINFASNDYLGLAGDLRIAEAAARAAGRFGWGTGSSRLVTGTSTLHHRLELETARFRGTESALVFGSGYQANLGVIASLAGEGDSIYSDALNHSSILAACKLSKAKIRVFKHLDYDDLERKLNGTSKIAGRKLIVTDSLFSISGEEAQLPRVAKLCERFDALMIVDDAHANAVIGKHGRGVAESQEVLKSVSVTIGTYSKALGSYGGFIACDETVREHLINHSKPFIYTTSLPLGVVAANTEALVILRKEGESLRQKLRHNFNLLRSRLQSADFEITGKHHILSIIFDDPERALFIADQAEQQGVMIYPMRYPSVPKGQDAVRISVSAAHTDDDIIKLANVLMVARDRLAGKDTSGVNRRPLERPEPSSLRLQAENSGLGNPDVMDADNALDNQMSAVDSSRLPAASEVGDFAQPDVADSGVSMIEQPVLAPFASAKTIKLVKDTDKEGTRKVDQDDVMSAGGEDDTANIEELGSGGEKVTQTLPSEESETGEESGKTLAPEPIELNDPVIDKIEGRTKKRKKGKKKNRTRAKKK